MISDFTLESSEINKSIKSTYSQYVFDQYDLE